MAKLAFGLGLMLLLGGLFALTPLAAADECEGTIDYHCHQPTGGFPGDRYWCTIHVKDALGETCINLGEFIA